MSDATYRIETAYEPEHDDDALPWAGRIYRLSDDQQVGYVCGPDEATVIGTASLRVETLSNRRKGRTVYVNDYGDAQPAPTPSMHSVKA